MSAAVNAHDLRAIEAFYQRWGPDVFAFCRLFLGDERRAELVCSKAFLDFCRELSQLPTTGEIPSLLVGLAYQAMQPCRNEQSADLKEKSLENCILRLDCRQRAVFIMRNVLCMTWPNIACASSSSTEEVRECWLRGMLNVRNLLPRDFFNR